MARINGIYFALASICLLGLCNVVVSQSSTDATVSSSAAPNLPVSCEDATAATVNGTLLLGTWYEAARKPVGGGVNSENCVQMIIDYVNGQVFVQTTYNIDPSALWVNQTINNTVLYNATQGGATPEIFTAVFNVTSGGVNTTYKIVDTDYSSYAFICGFINIPTSDVTTTQEPASSTTLNPTDAPVTTTGAPVNLSPAGAFILTRERQINSTVLSTLTANALVNYSDFTNISTVTQSTACYEQNGAGTTVPVLAMIMALVYSVLKFVN